MENNVHLCFTPVENTRLIERTMNDLLFFLVM